MSASVALHSVRLLLLLVVWGVLDVGSSSSSSSTPAADTSTAQNPNQERATSNGIFSQGTSTSAPRSITQAPILPFKKYNLTMKDSPKDSVFKTVILQSPAELELLCSLVLQPSKDVEKIEVVWKKEHQIIKNDTIYKNESKNSWCSRHEVNVTTRDQLGNYTCVYKTKPEEVNSTFHLQVPEPHGKSERIISYVGDFVVLACLVGSETRQYNPSSWVWYTKNGSEQVAINTTLMPEKYVITQEHANITKLKIMGLSEEDTGVYSCEAMFPLGARKGEVALKVLTYMTPLKPFLAIAAEVVLFVAAIFAYEACTKKKEFQVEVEKEFEQTETLKTEDSNGVENSATRQRKV
ncbi:embigin isoform X2 [Lacerta agilis]|uniref:embigin isoform X2 n=1 Tax=Lacerta agilis TaxID=80427 RepID=UPI0014199C2A|nr:embigin isoform X2 [Lacerta agilis]